MLEIHEQSNMDFTKRSTEEVGERLKSEKFSENTVRIFKGKYIYVCIAHQ